MTSRSTCIPVFQDLKVNEICEATFGTFFHLLLIMTSNIFSRWQQVQEQKKPQTPIFQCAIILPGKRWSQEVSSIHYYLSDIPPRCW